MSELQSFDLAQRLDALFWQLSRTAQAGRARWNNRDVRAAFDATWEVSLTATRIAEAIAALVREDQGGRVRIEPSRGGG